MFENQEYDVPATKGSHLIAVTCDACKTRFPGAGKDHPGINWADSPYQRHTTHVLAKLVNDCGSFGGSAEEREYHICSKCFEDKLEPFLKSLGAEPHLQEYNW